MFLKPLNIRLTGAEEMSPAAENASKNYAPETVANSWIKAKIVENKATASIRSVEDIRETFEIK